jgi:hypothetical protein
MGTYAVQVTEVFAIHRSENEVTVFFAVRDETKRSKPAGKFLEWNNSIWWICTNDFIRAISTNYWSVWLTLHQINNLSIPIEDHQASFNHILKDEILVIVAHVYHIGQDYIINGHFPFVSLIS